MLHRLIHLRFIFLVLLLFPAVFVYGKQDSTRVVVLQSGEDRSIAAVEIGGDWQVFSIDIDSTYGTWKEEDAPLPLLAVENLLPADSLRRYIEGEEGIHVEKIKLDRLHVLLAEDTVYEWDPNSLYYTWLDSTTVWIKSDKLNPNYAVFDLSPDFREYTSWKSTSVEWQKKPGLVTDARDKYVQLEAYHEIFRKKHDQVFVDNLNATNKEWDTINWMANFEELSHPSGSENTLSEGLETSFVEFFPQKAALIIDLDQTTCLILVLYKNAVIPVAFRYDDQNTVWNAGNAENPVVSDSLWNLLAINKNNASFESPDGMALYGVADSTQEAHTVRGDVKHMYVDGGFAVAQFHMNIDEIVDRLPVSLKPPSRPYIFGFYKTVNWDIIGLIVSLVMVAVLVIVRLVNQKGQQPDTENSEPEEEKETEQNNEEGAVASTAETSEAESESDQETVGDDNDESEIPENPEESRQEVDDRFIKVFSAPLLEKLNGMYDSPENISPDPTEVLAIFHDEWKAKNEELERGKSEVVKINEEKGVLQQTLSKSHTEKAALQERIKELTLSLNAERDKVSKYEKDLVKTKKDRKKRDQKYSSEAESLKGTVTKLNSDLLIIKGQFKQQAKELEQQTEELAKQTNDLEEQKRKHQATQEIANTEERVK